MVMKKISLISIVFMMMLLSTACVSNSGSLENTGKNMGTLLLMNLTGI